MPIASPLLSRLWAPSFHRHRRPTASAFDHHRDRVGTASLLFLPSSPLFCSCAGTAQGV